MTFDFRTTLCIYGEDRRKTLKAFDISPSGLDVVAKRLRGIYGVSGDILDTLALEQGKAF